MKIIYLVRHSKPLNKSFLLFENKMNEQIKNEKIPLSIEGERLASLIASDKFNNNIDYLWSSEYERALSTAKYIAELNDIPININSLFNERKIGENNGDQNFWITQLKNENYKFQGGESQKEVRERMLKGIHDILNIMEDNTKTVIVTHATAITFLLMNWCKLKDVKLENKKRWLTFRGKDVINDCFNTPEIFKLEFEDNFIVSIERLT